MQQEVNDGVPTIDETTVKDGSPKIYTYDELKAELMKKKKLEAKKYKRKPYIRLTPKVGRNDKCPCGSGNKYKKCCGQ